MASPSHQVASNGNAALQGNNSNQNAALQGNNSLTSSIEKLEGVSNYLNWKFAIKMLLTMDGLWNTIEGTETDLVRDQRALARIALCIKPALYQYIRNATTAKGAWKNLADIFENKGLLRRVLLLRQLHRIDYTQFSSMSEYIQGVMTLVQQLSDIGRKTDDAEVAEILLSGLPQEFEYLVSNLETVCLTNDLTSEIVRTRLLQEELRRNMVNYKDFNRNAKHTTVAVANNEQLKCNGVGDLMVNFGNEVRQLKNVLYVPQLATNLMSVSKFVESGFTVEFNGNGCSIYDSKVSGNRIALVGCDKGIYKLDCNIVKPLHNKVYSSKLLSNVQKTESTAVAVSTELWHRRLGHLGQRNTTDEEHYCTGSEDKSRCADSSSASHESVTSLSPDTSVRGEGVTIMEVPRVEATTRP
ncbi:putative retrovirus-related pol polyprotein from transposon tnt, partial [Operophtera brumata]